MSRIFLRDFPRSIKVFTYRHTGRRRNISTLDGTMATLSEEVAYDNLAELLLYGVEGIIAALALTNIELILNEEDEDGDETSNITEIISRY